METRRRLNKSWRQRNIFEAAAGLAYAQGYRQITQYEIALAAGVSASLIHHHFGEMEDFRHAFMQWAVDVGNLRILAQGVALRDPIALAADPTLITSALASLNSA